MTKATGSRARADEETARYGLDDDVELTDGAGLELDSAQRPTAVITTVLIVEATPYVFVGMRGQDGRVIGLALSPAQAREVADLIRRTTNTLLYYVRHPEQAVAALSARRRTEMPP